MSWQIDPAYWAARRSWRAAARRLQAALDQGAPDAVADALAAYKRARAAKVEADARSRNGTSRAPRDDSGL